MPGFNPDEYEPVEARIHRFWDDFEDGRIATDLVKDEPPRVIVRAEVFRDIRDTHPAATGYAQETIGEGMVNRTSALENCETSAIGRALANFGYAVKARPSREEMSKTTPAPQALEGGTTPSTAENVAGGSGGRGTPAVGVGAPSPAAGTSSVPADPPERSGSRSPAGAGNTSEGATPGRVRAAAPSDAPSGEVVTLDGERIAYGEGAAEPSGAAPSSPADTTTLAALLEAVDGSEVRAVNAVNKALHTSHKKADLEGLTPDAWAAGLRLVLGDES